MKLRISYREKFKTLFVLIVASYLTETFGKWSETSITTLKRITKMLAQKNDKSIGLTFLRLIQRLSLSVQKSNVQMIICRIRPTTTSLF
jgi:hypothetical protein